MIPVMISSNTNRIPPIRKLFLWRLNRTSITINNVIPTAIHPVVVLALTRQRISAMHAAADSIFFDNSFWGKTQIDCDWKDNTNIKYNKVRIVQGDIYAVCEFKVQAICISPIFRVENKHFGKTGIKQVTAKDMRVWYERRKGRKRGIFPIEIL